MQRASINATAEKVLAREFVWIRPTLYEKQLNAIFCKERYGIIEASTKAGKTVGCLAWIIEQAAGGKEGYNYWWVAPSYKQAAIAYRRAKSGLTKTTFTPNETKLSISLVNGTTIWFLSGEIPDNLYGEDVFAAVVDEASRLREEAWHALRSTITATRGPVRLIGNVKGRKNFFYRLARKAEAGAPNYHYAKIKAEDAVKAGVLDAAEIEDARNLLPEMVFRELYDAEPGDDSGNPFGITHIKTCTRPIKVGRPICFGVDLAKSTDYTVILGLDETGSCVYYERFQKPWKETMARIAEVVGHTQCLLDSTGVGDPIVEGLAREHGSNFEGFKFSSSSKQQIMEGLSVAVQSHLISFPEPVADEMEEFEYQYTGRSTVVYGAPEGFHDDCVCALALAVQKFATLSGALGLLKYYEKMLAAQRDAQDTVPEKAPGIHPPPTPPPPPESQLPSPIQAYNATMERLRPKDNCKYCQKPIGANRATDGFSSWHPHCDVPVWQRQTATLSFEDANV